MARDVYANELPAATAEDLFRHVDRGVVFLCPDPKKSTVDELTRASIKDVIRWIREQIEAEACAEEPKP